MTALATISRAEVQASIAVARSHGEKFFEQIVWQVENEAWSVLGYTSWDEMREAEYADLGVVAPRADRPELVSRLRSRGLTQQQIAQTVGASVGTVNSDLKFSSENEALPPISNARGQQRPATYQRRAEPVAPEPADDGPSDVEAAVAEFPDLAYYAQAGRDRDVVNMAGDLRRFRDRGELEERLDTLRRSIALDRAKRDGTYQPAAAQHVTEPPAKHCPTCTCQQEES